MAHMEACALCGRSRLLGFHHFIPRTCHRNKWFQKNFTREEMVSRGIRVCHDCHRFIHDRHTEKELGRHFNTLEALLADEEIGRFVRWVRKKR